MSGAGTDEPGEYPETWQRQLDSAAGELDPNGLITAEHYVAAFERRYGPFSLDAALRVLREIADHLDDLVFSLSRDPFAKFTEAPTAESPDEIDRSYYPDESKLTDLDVIVFVIYLLNMPPNHPQADEARATLAPLLECASEGLRWASAISLGHLRDVRAFPWLLRMLTEQLPAPEPWIVTSEAERQQCWERFSFEADQADMLGHYEIPEILWRWGDRRAIPALRAALVRTVRCERTAVRRELKLLWEQNWRMYESILVHALGRFEAFGALAGIEPPEGASVWWIRDLTPDEAQQFRVWVDRGSVFRLWEWQLALCEAALDARATPQQRDALRAYRRRTRREQPERRSELEHLLAEQFGLADEERTVVLRHCIDDRIIFAED